MEIRIATPEDSDQIAEMAIAFRNHLERDMPTDDQFKSGISRLLSSDDAKFYIAIEDEQPIGYVLQRSRFSMWASGIDSTIEDLFVFPIARKRGVGKKLIQFALQKIKESNCKSVCLDTNENNVASTKIYEQLGFNSVSKRWKGRQRFYRLNF
ncbi:MAG: GNAT family N-acetyltransferase [Desulfuromusa sp.]|nr:GNAT family N-acetyltransferase [Desulfuromusa sp.]